MASPTLYIGIMSGTSLDGADAVLVDLQGSPRVLGFASLPFPDDLRKVLLGLHLPAHNELHDALLAANALSRLYADTVSKLLRMAGIERKGVHAIGCHGQTIRHHPELGYTLQLQNPALLAELARITVVADFRSRDIAAGGQGAPLVPAFHDKVFRSMTVDRTVVNIGGISNITFLLRSHPATGFDCGPGNMLMDAWIKRHLNRDFDIDGNWAAGGKAIPALFEALHSDAYFHTPPPKSTGRDHFNLAWLEDKMTPHYAAQDVQATLLELTAQAIAREAVRHASSCAEMYLCGGGALNGALKARLQELLSGVSVQATSQLGIPELQVEAIAFAWLAQQALDGNALDLTNISGALHPAMLGAIYPA